MRIDATRHSVLFAFPRSCWRWRITAVARAEPEQCGAGDRGWSICRCSRGSRGPDPGGARAEFVEAKRALGFGTGNILLRTILRISWRR